MSKPDHEGIAYAIIVYKGGFGERYATTVLTKREVKMQPDRKALIALMAAKMEGAMNVLEES